MELEGKHPYPEGRGEDGRFNPPAPVPPAVASWGDDPDAWRLMDDPKEKLEGYCDRLSSVLDGEKLQAWIKHQKNQQTSEQIKTCEGETRRASSRWEW